MPKAASGYRVYTTGALTNVGANGDYWSSAPQSGSTNAGHLNFNSGNVNPLNSNPRAYGFPVRCVQHLRELFFILLAGDEVKTTSPILNGAGHGSVQRDRVDSAIH